VPVSDKSDLRDFLRIDDWEETKRTDHHRYHKELDNGEILRTKVSFGRGPAFNDPGLWQRVWNDQLGLRSEDEFWETLRTREPPDRAAATTPAAAPAGPTKPTWLYEFLVAVARMDPDEVLALTEEEAMASYLRWLETSRGDER
jgi:hypothetical protein